MLENNRVKELNMFADTEGICKRGYYEYNGVKIPLKYSKSEFEIAIIFSGSRLSAVENGVDKFTGEDIILTPLIGNKCIFSCENMDTFAMVQKLVNAGKDGILALNNASPVNPGGGVRKGARAQEEDLCRKSTLLMSLESDNAFEYYEYNRGLNNFNGSDTCVISPNVEVIKDADGNKMRNTYTCGVLTCAAPKVNRGYNGLSRGKYIELVYNRIYVMLEVSAYMGYRNIVLGAWGCGAFGNDAKLISNIFYEVITDFKYCGYTIDELFESINFAVLDKTQDRYNFREFNRNFRERI